MLLLKPLFDGLAKNIDIYQEHQERKTSKSFDEDEVSSKDLEDTTAKDGEGLAFILILVYLGLIVGMIGIFIWSIYALIKYWNCISGVVAAFGIFGIFFFPPLTLILVYATTNKLERDKGCVSKTESLYPKYYYDPTTDQYSQTMIEMTPLGPISVPVVAEQQSPKRRRASSPKRTSTSSSKK